MSNSVLEQYLAAIPDARAERVVQELDRVVMATQPELQVAIRYKILTYALGGDWGTWVCAINAGRKGVALYFLYGVLLDDPQRVLRAGSSVLMTWDFGFEEKIDPAAVGSYVAEAVRRNPEYKANRDVVLEASRVAAAKAGEAAEGTPLTVGVMRGQDFRVVGIAEIPS